MLLCNLTSDRKEDGLARLLVRSDLVRMCGKQQAEVVQECEDALRASHKIKEGLLSEGISGDEINKPLGKFFCQDCIDGYIQREVGEGEHGLHTAGDSVLVS